MKTISAKIITSDFVLGMAQGLGVSITRPNGALMRKAIIHHHSDHPSTLADGLRNLADWVDTEMHRRPVKRIRPNRRGGARL